MTGTILNVAAILIGGAIGVLAGNRLPTRMQETVMAGLGLMTIVIGISMAITSQNILIPLFSVLVGGIIGELIGIDNWLNRLGQWLEDRFSGLTIWLGSGLPDVTRTTPWVIELTATGGVLIMGIGLLLLELQQIRIANLLPAILIAPRL